MDDETPYETPGTTDLNAEATAFTKAIDKIVKANYFHSKPKLQEPDPFDGSDSQKLCTFILQCKLNFQDHKDLFEDDTNKSIMSSHFWKALL